MAAKGAFKPPATTDYTLLILTGGIVFAGVVIGLAVWRLPNRMRKALGVAQQPGPASSGI